MLYLNIGIIGKQGSGKTCTADYLVQKYHFTKISLADPIREIMSKYCKVYNKTDPRYRKLAQKIGSDWFRSEYPDIWINYLLDEAQNECVNYVCDDVRYTNEVQKFLNNQWILIYLNCPDEIRIERCKKRDGIFDEDTMHHSSETGVDDILQQYFDKIIRVDSSGTMENTYKQVGEIFIGQFMKEFIKIFGSTMMEETHGD